MADQPSGGRKPLPLPAVLGLDAVLLAASLLSFAYFHHVHPLFQEQAPIQQANIPEGNIYAVTDVTGTGKNAAESTAEARTTASEKTEKQESKKTESSVTTAKTDKNTTDKSGTGTTKSTAKSGAQTEQSSAKATQTESATRKTETVPPETEPPETEAPAEPDLSGWGAKWPDLFLTGYGMEMTDSFYRSHDVYVDMKQLEFADSNVNVADIYVRYLENFKTAFENDEFVNGPQEYMTDLAGRKNAIVAINGDFTGGRSSGIIMRDGTLYRDVVKGDLCVLFYDGSVSCYSKNEVDSDWLLANGAINTMTFGPYLVRDGELTTEFRDAVMNRVEPRSAFGYYEPGHYCFVTVDGRDLGGSVGVTGADLAVLMGEVLGCSQAYNLDGGASSQLYWNNTIQNYPQGYNGSGHSVRGLTDIFYIGEVEE